MKMRSYIKHELENENRTMPISDKSGIVGVFGVAKPPKYIFILLSFITISSLIALFNLIQNNIKPIVLSDDESIQLMSTSAATIDGKRSLITIPVGMVKANPFVPYRNIETTIPVVDVPAYNLVEPPEMINENSDAARVMDTVVSGILYDKFSPSAILNIEGSDYLVKKGDTVNNYKVVNISQDSVTVKLGTNVYQAGIGEILTEGTINHNDISNLNNKFGGVRK